MKLFSIFKIGKWRIDVISICRTIRRIYIDDPFENQIELLELLRGSAT